jgi:glycosyltransferase involved in cell wall biosynthesis
MRILQITDCYPPPLIGGRDLHVRMLSHELSRRGHDVEVATLAGPTGDRTEVDDGIPVHRMGGWGRALSRFYVDPERPFHPTVPDPGLVRKLANLIRERQPEVVHAHSWMLYSLLPFLPSRCTRLVVTMHEYGFVCAKNSFMHKGELCDGPGLVKCISCASAQYGTVRSTALATGLTLTRPLHRRVDRYIAISDSVAQACMPLIHNSRAEVEIIPPFIPDEYFHPVDTSRPKFLESIGDYIMFAGALGPHKGIDVLLEAYRKMTPTVRLVLLGLRRHDTPKDFPDGVVLAEDVSHDDVMRAWSNCLLAVVPSRWPEPWGMVAIEAMAAGRPVVASAIGGLKTLVQDGRTGVLVPPGDAAALRAGIQRLLDDPEERSRMGAAGTQRAAECKASELVPKIEQIYRAVIKLVMRRLLLPTSVN